MFATVLPNVIRFIALLLIYNYHWLSVFVHVRWIFQVIFPCFAALLSHYTWENTYFNSVWVGAGDTQQEGTYIWFHDNSPISSDVLIWVPGKYIEWKPFGNVNTSFYVLGVRLLFCLPVLVVAWVGQSLPSFVLKSLNFFVEKGLLKWSVFFYRLYVLFLFVLTYFRLVCVLCR